MVLKEIMKRSVNTDLVKETVQNLIFEANFRAPEEVKKFFVKMQNSETSYLAEKTLGILAENIEIASKGESPLCQDCGSVVVFLEIGQDVEIAGGYLIDEINTAVAEAYQKFYLRKSIVSDPLRRENTGTNTPAFIHIDIVHGDRFRIDIMLKGGGSENMSALRMFRPTASMDEITCFIVDTVIAAGPNPCPPLFIGVGIGGTADVALLNSKKVLLRNPLSHNPDPLYMEFEKSILEKVNASGVGPLGFGGRSTAAGVYIMEAPTHIASLPVAVNLNCHSFRRGGADL